MTLPLLKPKDTSDNNRKMLILYVRHKIYVTQNINIYYRHTLDLNATSSTIILFSEI